MKMASRFIASIALILGASSLANSAAAEPAEIQRFYNVGTYLNTCNNELVFYRGKAILITKELEDGTFRQHYQFHGTGINLQSGNEYVVNAQQHNIYTEGFDFEYNTTFVLVSKGPAPNQEVSYYANSETGETTLETVCKG